MAKSTTPKTAPQPQPLVHAPKHSRLDVFVALLVAATALFSLVVSLSSCHNNDIRDRSIGRLEELTSSYENRLQKQIQDGNDKMVETQKKVSELTNYRLDIETDIVRSTRRNLAAFRAAFAKERNNKYFVSAVVDPEYGFAKGMMAWGDFLKAEGLPMDGKGLLTTPENQRKMGDGTNKWSLTLGAMWRIRLYEAMLYADIQRCIAHTLLEVMPPAQQARYTATPWPTKDESNEELKRTGKLSHPVDAEHPVLDPTVYRFVGEHLWWTVNEDEPNIPAVLPTLPATKPSNG